MRDRRTKRRASNEAFTLVELLVAIGIAVVVLGLIGTGVYLAFIHKKTVGDFTTKLTTVKSGEMGHAVWCITLQVGTGTPKGIENRRTGFATAPADKGKIVQINDGNGTRGLGNKNPDGTFAGVTDVVGTTMGDGKIEIWVTVDVGENTKMSVTGTDHESGLSETNEFTGTP